MDHDAIVVGGGPGGSTAAWRLALAGLRPLLVPSRPEDLPEKVGFADDKWFMVPGGHGVAEVSPEAVYLAMALRNAGSGLAVLDRWDPTTTDRPVSSRTAIRGTSARSPATSTWRGATWGSGKASSAIRLIRFSHRPAPRSRSGGP